MNAKEFIELLKQVPEDYKVQIVHTPKSLDDAIDESMYGTLLTDFNVDNVNYMQATLIINGE